MFSCNDDSGLIKEPFSNTFLGKLVKKCICMNYVFQVNDSNFPQDMIEEKWTDESSNKK